ncbi:MAG: RNA polymerase sigma factor RpoD/SigA [Isosphaeraceae bacterium]
MSGAVPAVMPDQVGSDRQVVTDLRPSTSPSRPIPSGLLSAREECELSRRVASGDQEARERLIKSNLRLVVRIAQDFQGRGMSLEDLIGEGNLGLTRAADRYDSRFGTRFSTYAAYWIKEAIRAALCNTNTTIRVPAHTMALLNKWRRAERALRRETGRAPTDDEVAERLGLTESQRGMAKQGRLVRRVLSGEGQADEYCRLHAAPLGRDETPDLAAESKDDRLDLCKRLERLDAMERSVIVLRFGLEDEDPMTLMEVGQRLGVTREWVRKLELRAVQKLR